MVTCIQCVWQATLNYWHYMSQQHGGIWGASIQTRQEIHIQMTAWIWMSMWEIQDMMRKAWGDAMTNDMTWDDMTWHDDAPSVGPATFLVLIGKRFVQDETLNHIICTFRLILSSTYIHEPWYVISHHLLWLSLKHPMCQQHTCYHVHTPIISWTSLTCGNKWPASRTTTYVNWWACNTKNQ